LIDVFVNFPENRLIILGEYSVYQTGSLSLRLFLRFI